MDDIGHVLQAKFAHSYEAESSNGSKRTIRISPGDKYILLKKTNDDWWDVIPYDEDPGVKHFYVPSTFVKHIDRPKIDESDHPDFAKQLRKIRKEQSRRPQSTFIDGATLASPSATSALDSFQTSLSPQNLSYDRRSTSPIPKTFVDMSTSTLSSSQDIVDEMSSALTLGVVALPAGASGRVTPVVPDRALKPRNDPYADMDIRCVTPDPSLMRPISPDYEEALYCEPPATDDENIDNTTRTHKKTRAGAKGMSVTSRTRQRLAEAPVPVKPERKKEQFIAPSSEKTHKRTTSVNSESDVFSGETTNVRPEGYRFEFRDAKKSWVNVQSGEVWLEEYQNQTGDVVYFNEKSQQLLSELPSPKAEEPVPVNLVYKEGTMQWAKFEGSKKASKLIFGWGMIYGDQFLIHKKSPPRNGNGTILFGKADEPIISIKLHKCELSQDSDRYKKDVPVCHIIDKSRKEYFGVVFSSEQNDWFHHLNMRASAFEGPSYKKASQKRATFRLRSVKKSDPAQIQKELSKVTLQRNKRKSIDKEESAKQSTWDSWFRKRPNRDKLIKNGIIKTNYFGTTLADLYIRDKRMVPAFVDWCLERIDKDLTQDGIYRVAANQSTVHSLRMQVDQGVDAEKWKYGNDTHVLCGALKLFFRELPSPLITPKTRVQYNRWCQIPSFFNDDDGLIAELKAIIKESLDEPSRMTVKILFNHFCKVAAESSRNRMAEHNLAVVFGPTLIGNPDGSISFENILTHNNIVQTLINIFPKLLEHKVFPH